MNELPDYYDYVSSTYNDGREDEHYDPSEGAPLSEWPGNDMSEYEGELIEDEGNTDEA